MATTCSASGSGGQREIGDEAVWSLSTAKPGNGVHQLRDNNLDSFWQYDFTNSFPNIDVSQPFLFLLLAHWIFSLGLFPITSIRTSCNSFGRIMRLASSSIPAHGAHLKLFC